MSRFCFLFAILWHFSLIPALAGPFGLEMGMNLEEVSKICKAPPTYT